ncbi:MAG: GTPase/DUF3482 domain-containing protein [Phycisphaerales bacterium]
MTATSPDIRIAIVGHTNAGKTSLLRTLMRDPDFGEVSDSPGTTLDNTVVTIPINQQHSIALTDTPGLEDSIGLLEALLNARSSEREDGHTSIERFLADTPAAHTRFSQEAKAIASVLDAEAVLYVIDARERVLAKYRDELRILSFCARPIVPVLNFTADERARTQEWRRELSRLHMHAVAEFDTVVLESGGEVRLFEKLRSLLDHHRQLIDALIESRKRERNRLILQSARLIADMLIDVASLAISVDVVDQPKVASSIEELQALIRQREQDMLRDMLVLHRFRPGDLVARDLPIEGGAFGIDLFNPEALAEYSVRGGGGAAAGAAVGLTLDMMFGGLSLGAATALGAAIGAVVGGGRRPGRKLLEKVTGRSQLHADAATLGMLTARGLRLVDALLHRGHASVSQGVVDHDDQTSPDDVRTRAASTGQHAKIEEVLRLLLAVECRTSWSRIASARKGHPFFPSPRRDALLVKLAEQLAENMSGDLPSDSFRKR